MKRAIVIVFVVGMLLVASGTQAAPNDSYDLAWFSIDGGGGTSSSGNTALSGTIGQPDVGAVSGGGYQLAGGFWPVRTLQHQNVSSVYLPLIRK